MLDNPNSNPDDIVKEFTNIITPDIKIKRKNKSIKKQQTKKWYDYSCYEMSKKLKNVAKLFSKSPSNPHIRGSFCKTKKEYKKLIKMKKREWTNNMIAKLEDIETKDPKEYWKIVNELRENKKSETSFNTKTFSDFFQDLFSADKTKSESLNDQNVENFVKESLEKIQDPDEPDFTMKELNFAIKWLKKNKAVGPDGIPAELFKILPPHILKILLKTRNKKKIPKNIQRAGPGGLHHCFSKKGSWMIQIILEPLL